MANTILTPTQVTRAALVILHQKLNFIGNINRAYDDSFAIEGAKIGTAIKIRLPNQYTVRTGATLSTQTTAETSTTLNVTTQKGVDLSFTSVDFTMSIQDFSDRFLEPAMSVLAANVEADALSMINDVYQTVDNTVNASFSMLPILQARKVLKDALVPAGSKLTGLLTTQNNLELVNALKGLFQDSSEIKAQYRDGMMGRTGGFDFYENTLLTNLTSGTMSATTVNSVVDTIVPATPQSSINVNTCALTGTLVVGDVFTIATLNRVHPESKADTGILQQFVVTTAVPAFTSFSSISFSPAINMAGAAQNVKSVAIAGQLLVKIGNTSRSLVQSLFFHKDAFTFASADLILPKGLHFAAREVMDGLSLRILSQYDVVNDALPYRCDILYGYKTMRPQLAVKVSS